MKCYVCGEIEQGAPEPLMHIGTAHVRIRALEAELKRQDEETQLLLLRAEKAEIALKDVKEANAGLCDENDALEARVRELEAGDYYQDFLTEKNRADELQAAVIYHGCLAAPALWARPGGCPIELAKLREAKA